MHEEKITYVFELGRKEKLFEEEYSKEFYYGYHHFLNEYENTSFIELQGIDYRRNNFLYLIDKILRKVTNLPFHFSRIENKKILSDYKNSDVVIFSSERSAISSLYVYRKARKKKKIRSLMIVMGLFVKPNNSITIKPLKEFFIKYILKTLDHVVFLSRTEFNIAKEKYPNFSEKFNYIPFSVDTSFWNEKNKISLDKKNKILFIGNDGRRNFKKFLEIAHKLPDFEFLCITEKISSQEIMSNNVELISGHWNRNILTDEEIKNIYSSSRISIIPLHNSLQPSGQSVAQQSMAMGVPVIISRTDGFWDFEKYKNNENIVFQNNEDVEDWANTINNLYGNENMLKKISINGLALINKTNNLDNFYREIKNILKLD